MSVLIEHGQRHLANKPVETSEEKRKVEELRKTLLECDECCHKYIGAEEEKLLGILRVKSFHVKNAAAAIEKNEIFKRKYPEVYSLPFEKYVKAYEKNIITILRGKDIERRKVFVITLKNWDPAEISLEGLTKATTDLVEILLKQKDVQTEGAVGVLDFRGVGISQLAKQIATVGFHDARRGNDWLQGGSIIKVKTIFVLNAPFAFVQLLKALQFILSKKVRERLLFCNPKSKEFTSNFRKHQLPKSLNGLLNEKDATDSSLLRNMVTKDEN